MRKVGEHAVRVEMQSMSPRIEDVLRRGDTVGTVAEFDGRSDAVSVLIEADGEGALRMETLRSPENTRLLPQGILFRLVAGYETLARGHIPS